MPSTSDNILMEKFQCLETAFVLLKQFNSSLVVKIELLTAELEHLKKQPSPALTHTVELAKKLQQEQEKNRNFKRTRLEWINISSSCGP
jgi:hypothetical protein